MGLIWYFAVNDKKFDIVQPGGLDDIYGRFITTMMMHLNVEKDVRHGILMMKYVVNHYENFRNV